MTELTAKQQRFAEIYLSELNATKAAIGAGYATSSAHVEGARLLKNAKVRAFIDAAMEKRAAKAGVTADQVVEELRRIAFADVRKVVSWKNGVVGLVDSDAVDAATASAISSVSQGKDGEIRIKFHSKESSLVNLGKHLGLFRDGESDRNAPVTVNIIDPRSSAKAKK